MTVTITGTRHAFGTADVYVQPADATYTGYSRSSGAEHTIFPSGFYVEDDDDYGYRNKVTIIGFKALKDGTAGHRLIRLSCPKKNVPDNVWHALKEMRPDLTRDGDTAPEPDDEDDWACRECGAATDDGEGSDGLCGNCADRAEADRCPACGELSDYCRGHGEIGDPSGHKILEMHDAGDHSECHPDSLICD